MKLTFLFTESQSVVCTMRVHMTYFEQYDANFGLECQTNCGFDFTDWNIHYDVGRSILAWQ